MDPITDGLFALYVIWLGHGLALLDFLWSYL